MSEQEQTRPVVPSEFTAEKIKFTTPKKRKDKKDNVIVMSAILYDNKAQLFETPWLYTPFGVSSYKNEGKAWSITTSAPVEENDKTVAIIKFFDEWQAVDEKFTDFLVDNSKFLFDKEYTREKRDTVQDARQAMVIRSKEVSGKTYRNMSFKIYSDKNNENVPDSNLLIYSTKSSRPIKVKSFEELCQLIPKGTRVRIIFQTRFNTVSKHSITTIVRSIQFEPRVENRITGYAFSGPAPTEASASSTDKPSTDTTNEVEDTEEVEDSGEEVEEEVEEVEEEDDE